MTARKRAGADAFGAASNRSTKSTNGVTTPPPERRPRKYTMLLDAELGDALDERMVRLRRETGRRLHQSDYLRELVAMAEEDASIGAQVRDRLRE